MSQDKSQTTVWTGTAHPLPPQSHLGSGWWRAVIYADNHPGRQVSRDGETWESADGQ